MSRGVVHQIAGGFCEVCGETAEWLLNRGEAITGFAQCSSTYLAGYSTALDCVREAGHGGPHRSFGESEWDDGEA